MASSTTTGVIRRSGCPVHYWLTGPEDAPLVTFTHGATLDHRMFDAQLPALSEKYRVLTWDMRGHGRSRPIGNVGGGLVVRDLAEDLVAVLDHLGYERASFVGQSFGGHVVQEITFLYPERVTALATVGSSCGTIEQELRDRIALRLSPTMFRLWPYANLRWQTAKKIAVSPEVQKYAYEASRQIPKEDFLKFWNAVATCPHHEPGYRIPHPLLIVHGEWDRSGNIKRISPRWADRDPQSRHVVIPAAGHVANVDNPEFFNRLLMNFLNEFVPENAEKARSTQKRGA